MAMIIGNHNKNTFKFLSNSSGIKCFISSTNFLYCSIKFLILEQTTKANLFVFKDTATLNLLCKLGAGRIVVWLKFLLVIVPANGVRHKKDGVQDLFHKFILDDLITEIGTVVLILVHSNSSFFVGEINEGLTHLLYIRLLTLQKLELVRKLSLTLILKTL